MCPEQKEKKNSRRFALWKENHEQDCKKIMIDQQVQWTSRSRNHFFLQSKRLCGLQYTGFWRDGDSKAYATVKDANPPIYNEDTITEIFECCRHVQKRAYRHLNNKVTECKGQTFHHNGKTVKGIGGKGGLAKKDKIKLLGHYMEQQFPQNSNNVPKKEKNTFAQ